MFSPNLNSVQLKRIWLDSRNYLYKVRGCVAMGDNISVYKHHKGMQSHLQICTLWIMKYSVLYELWSCFLYCSHLEDHFRLEQTHRISIEFCFFIHNFFCEDKHYRHCKRCLRWSWWTQAYWRIWLNYWWTTVRRQEVVLLLSSGL